MHNHNPRAVQDELARAETRLTKLDEERDRLSRHIAELRDRLSWIKKRQKTASAQQTILPSTPAPTRQRRSRCSWTSFAAGPTSIPSAGSTPRRTPRDTRQHAATNGPVGLCDKRKVKCGECPNQAFIPVTEKTVHDHFRGRHVVGVYPMLQDETCWFLAVDFDKGQWQDDVTAFTETCRAKDCPSCGRAISIRQRRPRLVLLRRAGEREHRAQDGLLSHHRDHGRAPRAAHDVLRSVLPQPGHHAPRRLRQPHRPAFSGRPTPARQLGVRR